MKSYRKKILISFFLIATFLCARWLYFSAKQRIAAVESVQNQMQSDFLGKFDWIWVNEFSFIQDQTHVCISDDKIRTEYSSISEFQIIKLLNSSAVPLCCFSLNTDTINSVPAKYQFSPGKHRSEKNKKRVGIYSNHASSEDLSDDQSSISNEKTLKAKIGLIVEFDQNKFFKKMTCQLGQSYFTF